MSPSELVPCFLLILVEQELYRNKSGVAVRLFVLTSISVIVLENIETITLEFCGTDTLTVGRRVAQEAPQSYCSDYLDQ